MEINYGSERKYLPLRAIRESVQDLGDDHLPTVDVVVAIDTQ